jgi:hypothetical protein
MTTPDLSPVTPILRAEAAAGLAAALSAYVACGGGWALLASLFLTPDIAMLGYLRGPRIGAMAYNLAHWSVPAAALAAAGLWTDTSLATQAGLIWLAHIAFDRMMGYGLKLPTAFGLTHLGRLGRASA